MGDNGLNFKMRYCDIHDAPAFVTLFYVWGTPNYPKSILINDYYTLPVTIGLDSALSHMCRSIRKTQHLPWVDAICINQQDPEERRSQIQFMKMIFEQSAAVYAWLELPTEDTSMAFEKLEEFSKVV